LIKKLRIKNGVGDLFLILFFCHVSSSEGDSQSIINLIVDDWYKGRWSILYLWCDLLNWNQQLMERL